MDEPKADDHATRRILEKASKSHFDAQSPEDKLVYARQAYEAHKYNPTIMMLVEALYETGHYDEALQRSEEADPYDAWTHQWCNTQFHALKILKEQESPLFTPTFLRTLAIRPEIAAS